MSVNFLSFQLKVLSVKTQNKHPVRSNTTFISHLYFSWKCVFYSFLKVGFDREQKDT